MESFQEGKSSSIPGCLYDTNNAEETQDPQREGYKTNYQYSNKTQ